ncbi:hypothetical protein AMTR_s00062p00183940 [Amborella trichopoda]|uniref:Uncharacterized protein n=1 Tax=Amborella trichopoda TaxID=13333 RepID=U5D239_AMBTC|nr:hypothetical protein AMTR_s00062p00183940 [Amborella trichopoda]
MFLLLKHQSKLVTVYVEFATKVGGDLETYFRSANGTMYPPYVCLRCGINDEERDLIHLGLNITSSALFIEIGNLRSQGESCVVPFTKKDDLKENVSVLAKLEHIVILIRHAHNCHYCTHHDCTLYPKEKP